MGASLFVAMAVLIALVDFVYLAALPYPTAGERINMVARILLVIWGGALLDAFNP